MPLARFSPVVHDAQLKPNERALGQRFAILCNQAACHNKLGVVVILLTVATA